MAIFRSRIKKVFSQFPATAMRAFLGRNKRVYSRLSGVIGPCWYVFVFLFAVVFLCATEIENNSHACDASFHNFNLLLKTNFALCKSMHCGREIRKSELTLAVFWNVTHN